ncbi:MAG TPA: prepilin peptidase [Patescibacteria group bacterium]
MFVVPILFALGLIVGSFIGALTYRMPKHVSIVSGYQGRSICPRCKGQIRWYDNIPLISFLLLKGKCRDCKGKISYREPLIELGGGFIFALSFFNTLFPFYIFILIASVLLAIAVIDIENQIIPDEIIWVGLSVLLIWYLVSNTSSLYLYLLTGLSSALFLLLVNLITKGKGMGLGDVKLAILIGASLSPSLALIWFLVSFVTGSVIGIMLITLGRANMKARIAFAPFLIIGFLVVSFFGNSLTKLLLPI